MPSLHARFFRLAEELEQSGFSEFANRVRHELREHATTEPSDGPCSSIPAIPRLDPLPMMTPEDS